MRTQRLLSLLIAATLLAACESESPVAVTPESSPVVPPMMSTTLTSNIELTATKVDALYVDDDGDGNANPGETIRYTVVLTNVGIFDAHDVEFFDILDFNTGPVAGSLQTTPLARDDVYCTPPGTQLDVGASDGVLANDEDPDGSGLPRRAVVRFEPATSGEVVLEEDGSFSYTPDPDLEVAIDGFRYFIDDGEGGEDLADVDIVVASVPCPYSSGGSPLPAPQFDESIRLPLGTFNPGQVLTITFDVILETPFPQERTEVCNQGLVTGGNFGDVITDDPDVEVDPPYADPTCTPVELDPEDVVASITEEVAELEQSGSLNPGQAGSLRRQLDQAVRMLVRGRTQAAIETLESFVAHVTDLMAEGTLTVAEGEPLIQAANQVIEDLESA